MKSFVWYSPKMFKDNGWEIPKTWDDLLALSDKIAATGIKPWCAGIESGDATGWPATDWLEDVLLRTAGPDVYDQWVNHEIPFNDPQSSTALDDVGGILKNDEYVNGGFGDVKSIATHGVHRRRPPDPRRQVRHAPPGHLLRGQLARGHRRGRGRRRLRVLPAADERRLGKPVLGGGEFVTAFSDSPRCRPSRPTCPAASGPTRRPRPPPNGGWVSANKGLDVANVASPIDKLSVEILQDPDAVFRFDGSDLMPGAVGAGSFWKEMTAWIGEDQSTQDTLDNIEKSWP